MATRNDFRGVFLFFVACHKRWRRISASYRAIVANGSLRASTCKNAYDFTYIHIYLYMCM